MSQCDTKVLTFGLSIFVASYDKQKQKEMRKFLLTYFRLIQHEKVPVWYSQQCRSKDIPKKALHSRDNLTTWLIQFCNINIWQRAEDVITHPQQWGPHIWDFLYELSKCWLPFKKIFWIQLMMLLPDVLPCPDCATHLRLDLRKHYSQLLRCRSSNDIQNYIYKLQHRIKTRISSST